MSKLELILLGRFECLLPSGTRISLSMRKAEVLLAYLALTPGLRHPRERLINLLWSDRGEEQARNSLRQCLSAIKKSLGEVADMVLQVDRTSVSLIPELIDIDVHEFERLAAEGGYESLTTAADLYQGEFLEGISIRDATCQEWLDGERTRVNSSKAFRFATRPARSGSTANAAALNASLSKSWRIWRKPSCSATITVTRSNPPNAWSNRTRSANPAGGC
jgi:DNA-binding SARP family transcriptional activator